MATRGQIAYLADPNTIFSIYIHYDAYPEALGKTLNSNFNSDEQAGNLVMDGNDIRFIDDNGTVDRFDKGGAKQIKGEEPEDLFSNLYSHADNSTANYVYVWLEDKWITLNMNKGRQYFIGTLLDQIRKTEPTIDEDNKNINRTPDGHNPNIPYKIEGKNIYELPEGSLNKLHDKLTRQLDKLEADNEDTDERSEIQQDIDRIEDALKYIELTPEIPGFEGTRDALDNLFESDFVRRMQHRAGIIK
jgi:hypothetical protein